MARPPSKHKWKRRAGPVESKLQTVTGSLSQVGSLIRSVPWKTYRGPPTGETIGSG